MAELAGSGHDPGLHTGLLYPHGAALRRAGLQGASAGCYQFSVFVRPLRHCTHIRCEGLIGTATELLRVPGEIRPMAVAYLRIMFGGIPIVMAYNLAASVLRALGDGKRPFSPWLWLPLPTLALIFSLSWALEGRGSGHCHPDCTMSVRGVLLFPSAKNPDSETFPGGLDNRKPLCLHLMGLGLPMAFRTLSLPLAA